MEEPSQVIRLWSRYKHKQTRNKSLIAEYMLNCVVFLLFLPWILNRNLKKKTFKKCHFNVYNVHNFINMRRSFEWNNLFFNEV